ncbi:MFS transporter [Bowmanella denitrificans]|uniref:MFS transporter n=1 Tax=Bowmanella denitrificans TaxID=366582 RepID=UPI001C0F0A45|nr:MFS transporter [Bowmanella denitrificans]
MLQFTLVLDFMIIAPIGDALMKSLDINTAQFGLVVSSYAFSAAISGILLAGFIDRYDRKQSLILSYSGFILGTLLCAFADSYISILLARIVTGIFAGVSGALVMTIVSDLFAVNMRGRAISGVQMGFAISQILGVPLGIYIANTLGWHSTFGLIVLLALIIVLAVLLWFAPIDKHLGNVRDKTAWVHLWHTISNSRYRNGLVAVMFLTIGGFMLMPFTAVFLVNNVKISAAQLPIVFFSTGMASLLLMPVIGKLCDRFDRYRLFVLGSLAATIMVVVYTQLSVTPLWTVVVVNILLFTGILLRMSPAMAINTMVPEQQDRGAYMSLSSSLQQTAGGLGAMLAGSIVYQVSDTSPLQRFDILGYVAVVIFLLCMFLVGRVNQDLKRRADETLPH